MPVTAIIPAAGSGTRMGAVKQYLELAGKPLLEWTLSAVASSNMVDGIILVVSVDDVEKVSARYLNNGSFPKITDVVAGGATRGESVRNGVLAASTEYALIHDAARPFVSRQLIELTIAGAKLHGAASAALPAHDTVKKKDGVFLGETFERSSLLLIQTPQVFRRVDLLNAYDIPGEKHREMTDETTLIQLVGGKVAWVLGELANIKITTQDDLRLANIIAKFA